MNNGHQLNILLVDENEHDYIITRNLLARIRDRQFNLEWLTHDDEALNKLMAQHYTACFFDYDHLGKSFIKQAIRSGVKTPLISLTESENPKLLAEAMDAGAVDYIVKNQMTSSVLERVMRYAVQYLQLMDANSRLKDEVIETKKTAIELRKRGQQYQMLFDMNIYAVEVLNPAGVAIDCNPMFQQMVGYDRGEIIGKQTTAFMTERSRKILSRRLPALQRGEAVDCEIEFIHRDGTKFIVWRRTKGIFDHEGNIATIVAYSRDITERMLAVKKISILARALEQSSVAVLIADYRGKIEYVNFEFTELTGYSYDEAEGKHVRAFKLKHLPRELYEELWESINAGDEWHNEYQNMTKNGDTYWEEITVTPIYSSRGNLTHFIIIQANITARLQIQAETLQSQSRLGNFVTNQIEDLTAMNEALQEEIEERSRVEKALRRSRARLKAQYKGIPVPTYSWQISSDDFILVDYNNAAEQSLGNRINDMLGQKASEIFKDRTQVLADFQRCARDHKLVRREAPYRLISTGELKYFVTTYNFVPPNLIVVHIEDITHYKHIKTDEPSVDQQIIDLKTHHTTEIEAITQQLETLLAQKEQTEQALHHAETRIQAEIEQRQQLELTLKQNEKRIKHVTNNMDNHIREQYRGIPIPTYSWQMIGGEFILVDFNDAAAESMGRIVDFFGKPAQEIFKERPQVLADFATCYNEKRTVIREAPYELVTTGETRFFITTYIYLPPSLVIVHIQDVTEYKALEYELEHYKQQVELIANEHGPKLTEMSAALHSEIEKREAVEVALQESQEKLRRIALNGNSSEAQFVEIKHALQEEINKRREAERLLEETKDQFSPTEYQAEYEKSLKEEIEKRHALEERLTQTEAKMQAIAGNIDNRMKEQYRGIPIPTYSWQVIADEFILVDFNDAAAESMGRIIDFFGKPAKEIFKDRPQVLADFETCYREKRKVVREAPYEMITTGETRFFVTTYLFMPPTLIIVHIQDITEYKEIEEALANAKTKTDHNPKMVNARLFEAKKLLQQEIAKRKRAEKLHYEAAEKVKESSKWLKAMAQDHTNTLKNVQHQAEQEKKAREKAEGALAELKQEMSHPQDNPNQGEEGDLEALNRMNEQLQRELAQLQHAEKAIRQNRARLKAQYKGIPIPAYSWQRAGDDFILVDYNDAAEQASNGRIYDLMGTTASEAFKDRPQILTDFAKCFETKRTVKREAPYQLLSTKKGTYFVSTYNFVPPNLVVVYIQDITAQKQTEDALQRSEEQISLHCRLSPNGELTFVNDAYCWYFNQEREQVMGQFMPFVHEDDLKRVQTHLAALDNETNPVGAIEFRMVKPNGILRWQQWITLPIFDEQGRLVEIQGVGRDITRRKQQS